MQTASESSTSSTPVDRMHVDFAVGGPPFFPWRGFVWDCSNQIFVQNIAREASFHKNSSRNDSMENSFGHRWHSRPGLHIESRKCFRRNKVRKHPQRSDVGIQPRKSIEKSIDMERMSSATANRAYPMSNLKLISLSNRTSDKISSQSKNHLPRTQS